MDTKTYLAAYYENYDEDGRLTSPHGKVEFLTTMRYIEKSLRPGMRVLEIGAGTGRYSHTLAQMGYQVDAVELVEHNIELFRKHTKPGEPVTITQGNATDLSAFPSDTYDMTLLLGPMYHLFTKDEQKQALSEAVRVTRTGGVLCVAYCMADPSILCYGFIRGGIHVLLEKKLLDTETFTARSNPWDLFQLYRTEDIDALRQGEPVTRLHLVATDGHTNYMRDVVDVMDAETYDLYLQYHFATCERGDTIGLSHHTLDILWKDI